MDILTTGLSLSVLSKEKSDIKLHVTDFDKLRKDDVAFLKQQGYLPISLELTYVQQSKKEISVVYPIEIYVHLDVRLPTYLDPDVALIKDEMLRVIPIFNKQFQGTKERHAKHLDAMRQ